MNLYQGGPDRWLGADGWRRSAIGSVALRFAGPVLLGSMTRIGDSDRWFGSVIRNSDSDQRSGSGAASTATSPRAGSSQLNTRPTGPSTLAMMGRAPNPPHPAAPQVPWYRLRYHKIHDIIWLWYTKLLISEVPINIWIHDLKLIANDSAWKKAIRV
jgi:hypothetical protein